MTTETAAVQTNTGTFLIAEERLAELTKRLDKAVRKAVKLGLASIVYTLGEAQDLPFRLGNEGNLIRLQSEAAVADAREAGKVRFIRFIPVTVTGTTPRLAGWEFVATLQHLADDKGEIINLLRTVPSFKGQLPTQYRTATPENCDHCHKAIRTRKETFIVRNTESGEYKQVGRSCTQDFLGGIDPVAAAAALELMLQTFDTCSSEEEAGFGGGGGGEFRYDMGEFLSVVALFIRKEGWMSRSKAREFEGSMKATADVALDYLTPPRGPQARADWKKWVAENPVEADDLEVAEKAMAHAREDLAAKGDARSDYEHNLYVATVQATVAYRTAGITASLVPYYLREVERRAVREAELRRVQDSQFVGTEGEKIFTSVQVMKVIHIDSQYGTTLLHKLIDDKGNALSWFCSNADNALKLGETFLVKATVKKHEEYKGVKQTTLTRLSVTTQEEVELEAAKAARKAAREAKKAAKAQG